MTPPRLYDQVRLQAAGAVTLGQSVASLNDRVFALEGGTPPTVTPQVVNYQEDTGPFLNPGNGFYKLYVYPRDGTSFAQHATEASNLRTSNYLNVIVLVFNLNAYRGTDTIDASFITNTIRASLEAIRDAGFTCIVRFAYDYSGDSTNDPANARVLTHINQVADACNDNKDVILAYQAGFLGTYGEWFASTNHGNDNWPIASNGGSLKAAVVQRIMDQFEDRPVLIRYPRHLRYFLNDENWGPDGTSPNPGSPRVTPTSRLGSHNDSMMAGPEDGGTYEWGPNLDRRGDKPWLVAWLNANRSLSTGEEEDFGDTAEADMVARRARFGEFDSFRYHALSEDYTISTTDMWKETTNPATGRTYWEDLRRFMGYRYVMRQGRFPLEADSEGAFSFTMDIENVGYGETVKDYDFRLRFGAGGSAVVLTPSVETSAWYKDQVTTVTFSCTAPTLTAGAKALFMDIIDPDGAPSPEYNIRPANNGVWDGGNGRINLLAQVTV